MLDDINQIARVYLRQQTSLLDGLRGNPFATKNLQYVLGIMSAPHTPHTPHALLGAELYVNTRIIKKKLPHTKLSIYVDYILKHSKLGQLLKFVTNNPGLRRRVLDWIYVRFGGEGVLTALDKGVYGYDMISQYKYTFLSIPEDKLYNALKSPNGFWIMRDYISQLRLICLIDISQSPITMPPILTKETFIETAKLIKHGQLSDIDNFYNFLRQLYD